MGVPVPTVVNLVQFWNTLQLDKILGLFGKLMVVRFVQFINAEAPIDATLWGIIIDVKFEHEANNFTPRDITVFGIVIVLGVAPIVVKAVHPEKILALLKIVFTVEFIITVVNSVDANAKAPMLCTVVGIVIDVINELHPWNVLGPILRIVLGIVFDTPPIVCNNVHPLKIPVLLNISLIEDITTVVNDVQFWNALFPIMVIWLGIVIDVNPVHESKTLGPIYVAVFGINVIFVKFVHPEKILAFAKIIGFVDVNPIVFKLVQFWNAEASIIATDDGIVIVPYIAPIVDKLLHPKNVEGPILTIFGKVTFDNDVHPLNILVLTKRSLIATFVVKSIVDIDVHPWKAEAPIGLMIELGNDIVLDILPIVANDVQPWNAEDPMVVTTFNIFILVNDVHPLKILLLKISLLIVALINPVQFWNADAPTVVTAAGIFIFVNA